MVNTLLQGLALVSFFALTTALCPFSGQALSGRDPLAAVDQGKLRDLISKLDLRDAATSIDATRDEEKRDAVPLTEFNENQLIDVSGDHRWIAPGPTDM